MANNFQGVENSVDNEIERKKQIKLLENTIERLTKNVKKNGLTEEQEFLIKYYDLDEEYAKQEKINFSKANHNQLIYVLPENQRNQIEKERYEILINMFATFKEFDSEEINKFNDIFHKKITDYDDYIEGFEEDPLMIKKMRNLQMLNRMAHEYTTIFRTLLYENPELKKYSAKDKKSIENYIGNLFISTKEDKKVAIEQLSKIFDVKKVNELNKNEAIKYCVIARKWMYTQKDKYLIEILEELKNSENEYNYGIIDDTISFDVPGYGQFTIHPEKTRLEQLKKLGIKEYKGDYLGDVIILSKADPELLKNVNYDKLSEKDKQRYRIASQKVKSENKKAETLEKNSKNKENEKIEILVKNSKNPEEAQKIVDIVKKAGLNPEEVINEAILAKGKPEIVEYIIEIIQENKYGLELNILIRCKSVLSKGEDKAVDIIELLDKINDLGLNVKDIITENPSLLTVAKSDKIESIYNNLKQYKIDLTNSNIATAFMGTSENIKRNMDLAIEKGLYDFAKTGVRQFFTTKNKILNMKVNLLREHNESLILEQDEKRKINANLFLKEQDLMNKYGISKKEILEELSAITGQELIKDSKYYIEEESEQKPLSNEQQELSNNIYEKLRNNQLEEDIVIKIGDYYYSAIKVKEQINNIISNLNIQDLENEDVNEILKIALFKNKNITQQEIDDVSEQIQNLDKKEIQQEELDEEQPYQENVEEETTPEEIEDEETKVEVDTSGNKKYDEIRQMTEEIIETENNIETMGKIITRLKEVRKTLRNQIEEVEGQINQRILKDDESKDEIIQDIKRLRQIVNQQKEKRKEVKQMIKTYKKNKKIAKYTLQQKKEARDNAIDEIEL